MTIDHTSSGSAHDDGVDRPAPLPPHVAAALAALDAATDVLAGLDWLQLDGPQAEVITRRTAAAASRLTASAARGLPVVEADGLWAVDGARSFPAWVARRHHVAARTAAAQVRLGRTLRDHLPLTDHAVLAGEITIEHAQVIATLATTTEQRRAALADADNEVNEAFLVEQAGRLGVDDLRTLVRKWAAYTDPDADDRGYVEACDREHLEISRLYDGYELTGRLTVEHGQALKAALRAVTPVPAAGDERTATQRRAQALADLAKVAVRQALVGTSRTVRPQINVLVDYPTFAGLLASARTRRATQGELGLDGRPVRSPSFATRAMLTESITGGPQYEDGTPICRADLDLVACDSGIARTIFGPRSEVLDVGRTERTFTGPRRAALIARDKHCRYPGCSAPPILCDGHHIDQWARDHGRTAVHRGVLLCTFHHRLVHTTGIDITSTGGRLVFTDRHGQMLTADSRRASPLLL